MQLQLHRGHGTDGWLRQYIVTQSDNIHSLGQTVGTHTHTCPLTHVSIHLDTCQTAHSKNYIQFLNQSSLKPLKTWFQSEVFLYNINIIHGSRLGGSECTGRKKAESQLQDNVPVRRVAFQDLNIPEGKDR